jgi:hypothetical protein
MASTVIGAGKYVSKLKSTSSVKNSVTDSAVIEFVKEIKRIRTEKVSEELLKNVKAGYITFCNASRKPTAIARYALNVETEELTPDFMKTISRQ